MKFFTFIKNIEPEYQEIIDRNIANGIELTVLRENPYGCPPGVDRITRESDYARIRWLADNPHWNWLDADCEVVMPIDYPLKPDTAYFLNYAGYVDIAVILGNGAADTFKQILDEVDFSQHRQVQGWLNRHRDQIGILPNSSVNEYFKHHGLHDRRRYAKSGEQGTDLHLRNPGAGRKEYRRVSSASDPRGERKRGPRRSKVLPAASS